MDSSNKAERVFHEQISRSEEKEHMAGQGQLGAADACVPTLLAFTLFHYEPPARIWSCSQPERQSNLTSTIQRANITSKNISPCRISIRQPYSPPTSIHRAEMQENRSVSPSVVLHESSLPTA